MTTKQTTKQRIETKKERISQLKKQIDALELKQSKRIHAIAQKAGLYDIVFKDDELIQVFKAFINSSKKTQGFEDSNNKSTD